MGPSCSSRWLPSFQLRKPLSRSRSAAQFPANLSGASCTDGPVVVRADKTDAVGTRGAAGAAAARAGAGDEDLTLSRGSSRRCGRRPLGSSLSASIRGPRQRGRRPAPSGRRRPGGRGRTPDRRRTPRPRRRECAGRDRWSPRRCPR